MSIPQNYTSFRSCAFILLVRHPMLTVAKICELMATKKIAVDNMQFQVLESGDAKLVIHCMLEKDRIGYIGRHFEEMSGVKAVDWMNARSRTKQY